MITSEIFNEIKARFGHYASWAIWAKEDITAKSNIGDLSVFEEKNNPTLFDSLRSDVIYLGLNISRPIERQLGNFHDPRPMATDFKIRHALQDTIYWGGYMTDIIKDFEEKVSGNMMRFLKTDSKFKKDNIEILRLEIEVLRCEDPLIVAFGRDAELIARKNLGKEFRICGIPHYANYSSKRKYREEVLDVLFKQKVEPTGAVNVAPRSD
jgi:hypothetical protein